MCVQGPVHICVRNRLRVLEAGGCLPGFAPRATNSGVESRLGAWGRCLVLMADSLHGFPRPRVNYTVRVGSPWIDQMTKTSSDIAVLQVIVHSRYRSERYWSWVGRANDIGLLKLQQVLQYSKYMWPVCLPGLEYEVQDGSICTVTGWGSSKDGESQPPQTRGWWERGCKCRLGPLDVHSWGIFPKEPTALRTSSHICTLLPPDSVSSEPIRGSLRGL